MQRRTWPAIAVMAVALSPACASPAPTPSPTYSCTPEQGGIPTPCSANEHEQAQQRDATYQQAEAVYLRYWNEMNRLSLLDVPTFTEELAQTTSGQFEHGTRVALTPEWHRKRVAGEVRLVRIDRLPGHSRSGSTVALQLCIDGRSASFLGSDTALVPGLAWEERAYLAPVEGTLKLISSESKDVVSCSED